MIEPIASIQLRVTTYLDWSLRHLFMRNYILLCYYSHGLSGECLIPRCTWVKCCQTVLLLQDTGKLLTYVSRHSCQQCIYRVNSYFLSNPMGNMLWNTSEFYRSMRTRRCETKTQLFCIDIIFDRYYLWSLHMN